MKFENINPFLLLLLKKDSCIKMKNDFTTKLNEYPANPTNSVSQTEREMQILKRILQVDSTGYCCRYLLLFDFRNRGFPTHMIIADLQRLENEGFIKSMSISGITVFAVI